MYCNSSPRSGLRWYFLLQKQVEMEGYLPLTSLVMLEMRLDQDWPFEANYRIVEISLDWFSTFWEELVLIFFHFHQDSFFLIFITQRKNMLTFSKKFSMVNFARNFLYSALSCSSWNLICSFLSFDTPPTLWDNLSSAIRSFLANLNGWPPPPSILAEKYGCSVS